MEIMQVAGIDKLMEIAANSALGALFSNWTSNRTRPSETEPTRSDAGASDVAERTGDDLRLGVETTTQVLRQLATVHNEIDATLPPSTTLRADYRIGNTLEAHVRFERNLRLRNLLSILHKSATQLQDTVVPDKDPNPEFRSQFFTKGQHVFSENMQERWARILAGEVLAPGTTSIRTLAVLENLDQSVAVLFERLCAMSISIELPGDTHDQMVLGLGKRPEEDALHDYGIAYRDLLLLAEYELVTSDLNATFDYAQFRKSYVAKSSDGFAGILCFYRGNPCKLIPPEEYAFPPKKRLKMQGISFSRAGKELSRIVDVSDLIDADSGIEKFDHSLRDHLHSFPLRIVSRS